ncbi:hypothetical protein [Thiohalorhabdus methylotrophus]|uniref:Galactose oxidase, central domain n=1 Tax=Thiohalorhabdus methylotrophus TaxID=3242694 RepID=A0ABV4U0K8_9GAMM
MKAHPLLKLGLVSLTVLLASCGSGSSGGGGSGGNQQTSGTDIPAGTWFQQDPKAGEGEPEYRPYSGVVAGNGRAYFWGGGHFTHGGNDIDAYDIAGDEWVQLTEEENWNNVDSWDHLTDEEKQAIKSSQSGGWDVDILTPRGRPLPKHSYSQMAWWPDRGLCLLEQRLWCYDPSEGDSDGAWQELASNPFSGVFDDEGSISVWNLTYDPKQDTLVTVYAAGGGVTGGFVYQPDNSSNPWRQLPEFSMRADGSWSQVYSAYNPDSEWHIVYAGQMWRRMNLTTGEVKEMAQLRSHPQLDGKLEEDQYGPRLRSFSMEWSPELDSALVAVSIDNELQLWTYDPSANSWSRFQLDGEGPTDAHANWDTLARDPKTGVYVFVAKEDQNATEIPETWTFKISGS